MTIVATHARQHHRHSELMLYSDWYINHVQNPTPNSIPAFIASQYHRGNRAPVSTLTPTATITAYATSPSIGFGNPNAAA
ncbi:hypothetical protein DSC45_35415 [Streptomyces sp. YIM 130001]|nr:hypothetical protein DSC45_35415 [Streptomyces sp. YIM 130001]